MIDDIRPVPGYVLKIEGLVTGQPTPFDGTYLLEYDPSQGEPGQAWLVTVATPAEAKKFSDIIAALDEWKRIDPRQPIDWDGSPNRPLTAFSVSPEPVV